MTITAEQRIAIEKMFAVVAPSKLERWSYLLSRDPSKWSKITPIDVWPLSDQYESQPRKPMAELLRLPPLLKYFNSAVLVLRCGHSDNPSLSTMKLKDVYPGGNKDYSVIFEGFVCVDPGKIAIAENHEGGTYVYGV